ncbi:MAG TPA: hypothetical protein VHC73_10960 [Vitreimonas sp.]|nr:hypothetical protein [Vitreimonas sp.]
MLPPQMDCPLCKSGVVEREGTQYARLFQCRFDDARYMVSRAAFDAFVELQPNIQRAALEAARKRSGQAVPVVTLEDMAIAHAWREPVIDVGSVKVVRPQSPLALKARNDI